MTRSIADSWAVIERKLDAPKRWWTPGASNHAIADCERALGVALPADYRHSLTLHDGFGTYLGSYELSSLNEVVDDARMFDEIASSLEAGTVRVTGPVRAQRWNKRWVPIVHTSSANTLVLDLDPLPAGNVGQVVEITREMNVVEILAPSFAVWLERFADELDLD
ncbi:MAG: SMI1/KNR4 family protein [Kofleriaceae bacterium]